MKKALITGVSGQDGYLLSEFLIKKKYKIIGIDFKLPPLKLKIRLNL